MAEPDWEPLERRAAETLTRVQDLLIGYLRRYHRWQLDGNLEFPDEQVLIVANHGFGGLFDLNIAALMAANRVMDVRRPTTSLVHQITWALGLGPAVERFFLRPASRQSAIDGFARGHHVLVLPGGDVDAFKAHPDRDKVVFAGRSGFARLAIEAGVPILPIVTSGAGNSLFVISDGQRLAKALRLDRLLRLKTLPLSLSLPWGINLGVVGLVPYLPLPARLRTRVLEPMHLQPGERADDFARRVEAAMQAALTDLAQPTRGRLTG